MVTTLENTSSYRDQCSVHVSDSSLPEEDEEDASSSRNILRNTTMLTDVTRQQPEEISTSSYRDQCSVHVNDSSLPEEDEEDASSSRNILRNTTMITDVTRQRPEEINTSSYRDQCSVHVSDSSLPEEDEEEDEEEEDDEEERAEDIASLQRKSLSLVTAAMQNSPMPSSIFMENSNDVQIGPRLHYNAPVTINQYVNVSGSEVLSQEDLHQQAIKAPEAGFEPTGNGVNQAKMSLRPKSSNAVGAAYGQLESKANVLRLKDRKCWLTVTFAAVAITTAALLIYYYTRGSSSAERIPPVLTDDPPNPNTTLPDGGRILSKSDWGGFPAKQRRELPHPTPFVVISHTAGASCFDTTICASIVRNIQDDHIGNVGMDDIGYNFLVSGDGNVFEGRGWDTTNFHASFVKRCNIAVCFMGHFVHEKPTGKQVTSVLQLLDLGVKLGKLETDYKLVAHSQTSATLSPGNNILSIIQKWPHFWVPKYNDTV